MNILFASLNIDFQSFWTHAKNVFLAFNAKDAFEILLLAAFFFIAFRFIRGRKAGALVFGIVICLLLLTVSYVLDFKAFYNVFRLIINNGALLIIVIFQPEIREALEKIGSGSIKGILSFADRRKKKEMYVNVIDNITNAVAALSSESTGALIVVEGTTKLSEITNTGVIINADVNSLLLRNLFYNKAPLHDGAVVISDGKIAAAGCFLPLTRRIDVDPSLGTRHRAAIGMSESSDAIIVVVSEETGKISVAHDCELKRSLKIDELKEYLMENIIRANFNFNDKN